VLRYNELVSSTSGAARINIIKTAARLIVERPLFGWGPAGFSEGALRYGVDHPYVHNVVVELFVEYGLFVGALFGVFLLLTCYRAVSVFKYLKQKENERGLETLLNSSVLLFLNYFVASLFSGNVVDARAVFVFALTTELIVQRVKERTECGLCSET
jgi:O-antigen ligase